MSSGRRHTQPDGDARHSASSADVDAIGDSIARLAERVAALETMGAAAGGSADGFRRIESMLESQRERLETLAAACRASEGELQRLTQELRLVGGERDRLRDELDRIDGMQTDTIAFDEADDDDAEVAVPRPRLVVENRDDPILPSIDELIALNAGDGPWERARAAPEADSDALSGGTGWHELLPADVIVAQAPSETASRKFADEARWRLVRTDVDPPQTYALDEPLVTVGRSPSADIQVDTGYISRIHARLLRINATIVLEDAGSKNGVKINGERVDRWPLKHGDMLEIGAVPFRFIDLDVGD